MPISEVSTWLRSASARSAASASASVSAGGQVERRRGRGSTAGTAASISSSSDAKPSAASIVACSAGVGPDVAVGEPVSMVHELGPPRHLTPRWTVPPWRPLPLCRGT